MRWTEDDPGAGDVAALRALAATLEDTTDRLDAASTGVRRAANPLTTRAWTGQAADAWHGAHQDTDDALHHLVRHLAPLGDAIARYATEVEAIAAEADTARHRQATDLADLTQAARTAPPPTTPAEQRRRRLADQDERRAVERRARDTLQQLADDRRRADRDLRTTLADLPVSDWDAAQQITVPTPRTPAGNRAQTPQSLQGALALGKITKDSKQLLEKASIYQSHMKAHRRPPRNPRVALQRELRLTETLRLFKEGKQTVGKVGGVGGATSTLARVAGKAFLPLTLANGIVDLVTGGGYEGARGWATRGFGLAGAAGVVALAINPATAPVAMAAILAYSAWSLGNLIWDNRESIGAFFSATGSKIRDGAKAVSDATTWLGKKITGAVTDIGSRLLPIPRSVFS